MDLESFSREDQNPELSLLNTNNYAHPIKQIKSISKDKRVTGQCFVAESHFTLGDETPIKMYWPDHLNENLKTTTYKHGIISDRALECNPELWSKLSKYDKNGYFYYFYPCDYVKKLEFAKNDDLVSCICERRNAIYYSKSGKYRCEICYYHLQYKNEFKKSESYQALTEYVNKI